MADVILHHYPQSPVSEKVRVVLGMKGLDWRSVTIPRIPPKPDLMPLTGGYRLTPVMQVGADVFCDSQCIIRELERLKPSPTLFPGGAKGMAWLLARWCDGPLFNQVVALIFGDAGETMPEDFQADRVPLYFGPGVSVGDLVERLPETLAQVRGQLAWMDERVSGRDFMLGPEPGLPDALCYYLCWFIRGRYSKGPEYLSEFQNLVRWEDRVKAIGHGRPTDMEAAEALDIAKAAEPRPAGNTGADPRDPLRIAPGETVTVTPTDVKGACPAVTGTVTEADVHGIAIARDDDRVGAVVVHFPRVGYRIQRV